VYDLRQGLEEWATELGEERKRLRNRADQLARVEDRIRLLLAIEDRPVVVAPEPIKSSTDLLFTVPSRNVPGKSYNIRNVAGVPTCDCPAGQHGKPCWHLQDYQEFLAPPRHKYQDVSAAGFR
jgi:hypothetical protein